MTAPELKGIYAYSVNIVYVVPGDLNNKKRVFKSATLLCLFQTRTSIFMCFSHFHNVLKAFISITMEKDEFKLILFSKYTEL
jgi:hypothetical protein